MDGSWLEVVDYLNSFSEGGAGVATHERFRDALPAAIAYEEIGSHEPESFQALVLHKGLYDQIDPSFLHRFLSCARPTFANEVFIVLSTAGPALDSGNPNLGPLRQITQWAAAQADRSARPAAKERVLAADVVLKQMANFIARRLAKPLDPARADSPIAIAETAERFNDSAWFWVDDSAKVAELFAVPQLRNAYPALADAALDHVLRLSPDRIIQRRSALPDLKLVDANPEAFSAYNSFFKLTGNLKAGIVRPSIRFNDNRSRFTAVYGGNVLRFRYRGRRQAVDVEDAIVDWRIEELPDRIVFTHTSAITARPLIGSPRHVCNLTYRYSLWKARPVIELEARISTLSRVALYGVQLSSGFDQLTAGGRFDAAIIGITGRYQQYAPPASDRMEQLRAGPADYLSISELGSSADNALAIHVRFRNGAEIGDIISEGTQPSGFHWIYPRYALGRVGPGETRTIVEDRLLTGGGYYSEPDIYLRILDGMESAHDLVDPSMSYDIGAELNAAAVTLLFAKENRYRAAPSAERLATLKEWYDRHLNIYLEKTRVAASEHTRMFIRGLSFVILSLDCMVRAFASAEYRHALDACVARLLWHELPVAGGRGESIFSPAGTQLGSHCAALLALARAAVHGDPEHHILDALSRALRGTLILPGSPAQHGRTAVMYAALCIRSRSEAPPKDGGFWVYQLGLALRAFHTIRQVHAAGFLPLDQGVLVHVDQLIDVAREGLLRAVRHQENDSIEVLTSVHSGETNSETQPWAALGLVPAVEWELYGRPAATDIRFSADIRTPVRLAVTDSRVKTAIGVRRNGVIEVAAREAGTGLYGPYVDLPRGSYVARMYFAETSPLAGSATMDVCTGKGSKVLAKRRIQAAALRKSSMTAALPFESACDLQNVEVRLFCEPGFHACISSIEIAPTA
jgi:hypothetical protein